MTWLTMTDDERFEIHMNLIRPSGSYSDYKAERMKSWRFRWMYRWYLWTGGLHDRWDIWRDNYDEDGHWRGDDVCPGFHVEGFICRECGV